LASIQTEEFKGKYLNFFPELPEYKCGDV